MRPSHTILFCSLAALSVQAGWDTILRLPDDGLLRDVVHGLTQVPDAHSAVSESVQAYQHSSTVPIYSGERRLAGIGSSSSVEENSFSTPPYPQGPVDRPPAELRPSSSNAEKDALPNETLGSSSSSSVSEHGFTIPEPLSLHQRTAILNEAVQLLKIRGSRLVNLYPFRGHELTPRILRETYVHGLKRPFRLSESLWAIKHSRYFTTDFAHIEGGMTPAQTDRRMYIWKVTKFSEGYVAQLVGSIDTSSQAKRMLDMRPTYSNSTPNNVKIIGQDSILDTSKLEVSQGRGRE